MSKGLCVTATAWQLLAFSQPQLSSTSSSGDASTPNPRPKPGSNPHGTTSPAASWTAAAAAESERIRARERLEASIAALRELQLLREEREASVRQALTRPTTQRQQQQPQQRRGKERCYGRGPGRSDGKADDALLAVGRDLELIKEQLQCGLGKPCALERPLSELRVDTDGTDVDSRPSSGFYSMSEDGSLSLSNSCSSISSSGPAPAPHAASTSTPSSAAAPAAAATTTMTGQLPVRLRRPAARPRPQERPRSAVELPSFLRTTGQQQQHHHQQQRSPKAKAGPSRPQSSYDLGDGSDARTSPVGLADPVTSAPGRDPDPRFRCDLRSRDGSEVYRYPSPLHAIAMQSSAFLHQRGAGDDRDAAASPDGKPPTGGRTHRHRRHDDAGADDEGSAANVAPPGVDKVTAYIAALLKRRGQKTRRRTSGAGAASAAVERKASDAAKTSASPSAEAARGRPITNLSVRYKHGAAAAASPVPAATAYGGRAGGAAGSPVGGSSVNLARSPRGAGGTLPALVRPASIAHFDTSRYHDDDEDDCGGGDGDDDERRWRASGPHVHPSAGDRRSSSEKSPNLQQQQSRQQQQQQQSTDRERECRRRALASVSMDLRPQRGAGWWGAAAEPTAGALGWQQGELGRPQYQQRVARICKLGHGSWAGSLPKSLDLRGGYRHRQDDDDDDHEDGASDRRRPGNAARSSSSKRHRLREGVELVRQSFRLPGRRRRASGERASSELDVSGGGRQPTEREETAGGSAAFDYRRRLVLHPSEVRGAGAAGTRAGEHRRWCSTMEIARGGGGCGNDDDDAGGDAGTPPEPPRWLMRAGARDGAWSPSWAVRGHADASPGYPNVYPAAGCPGELLQRSAIAEMSEDDADDADEADGAAGRLPADGSAEPRSSGSPEGLRGPCRVSQQVRAVPSAVKRKIRQRIADAAKTSTDV